MLARVLVSASIRRARHSKDALVHYPVFCMPAEIPCTPVSPHLSIAAHDLIGVQTDISSVSSGACAMPSAVLASKLSYSHLTNNRSTMPEAPRQHSQQC